MLFPGSFSWMFSPFLLRKNAINASSRKTNANNTNGQLQKFIKTASQSGDIPNNPDPPKKDEANLNQNVKNPYQRYGVDVAPDVPQ